MHDQHWRYLTAGAVGFAIAMAIVLLFPLA